MEELSVTGHASYNDVIQKKAHNALILCLGDGMSFVIDDVRYIPDLKRNLISLGTLEKEGHNVKM